jgi:large subunit ribosomal protein L24
MNRARRHIHKGDQVMVITGNSRGATGKVLQVLARKNLVLIEGVRIIKKHQRKSQEHPQGQIVQREGPIHISNLKLVEAGEGKAKAKTKAKELKKKKAV